MLHWVHVLYTVSTIKCCLFQRLVFSARRVIDSPRHKMYEIIFLWMSLTNWTLCPDFALISINFNPSSSANLSTKYRAWTQWSTHARFYNTYIHDTLVKIELEIHKYWVICFRWWHFGYSVQCSTQLSLIDMFSWLPSRYSRCHPYRFCPVTC